MWPASVGSHHRRNRSTEQEDATEVGADVEVEVGDGLVPWVKGRREADHAGVGDGDVDAAMRGDDVVDEPPYVGRGRTRRR